MSSANFTRQAVVLHSAPQRLKNAAGVPSLRVRSQQSALVAAARSRKVKLAGRAAALRSSCALQTASETQSVSAVVAAVENRQRFVFAAAAARFYARLMAVARTVAAAAPPSLRRCVSRRACD
jgi:hypothetical protein